MKKNLLIGGAAALATTLVTKKAIEKKRAAQREFVETRHKILIVGATSAIAQETARLFAAEGNDLFLVARNANNLQAVADDLRVRGAAKETKIETAVLDLNELSEHAALLQKATQSLGGLDIALIAHGTLGDQEASQADFDVARQELKTNFFSVVSLLTLIANQFETQKSGVIAVISSVAGDRGRGSNYVYGTAKAGVSAFLQGLRNRLSKAGVSVITIKPGFVDTPMTAHIDKGPLFVGPDAIAKGIYQAILNKKDVVYLPAFWFGIMSVIIHIPESIFKRLSL